MSCAAGALPQATRERIALAVAERRGDSYSIAQHAPHRARRGPRHRRGHPRTPLPVGRPQAPGAAHVPRVAAGEQRASRPAPRRGGARARLDRRGAARGGRAGGDERVPEPDRQRRGVAAGQGRLARCCRRLPSACRRAPVAAARRALPPGPRPCTRSAAPAAVAWVRSHLAPLANGPRSITVVRTKRPL